MRIWLLALLLAFSASLASASDLTLRYAKPAADTAEGWEREALPIGNGRIGAMLFGQVAREHLQFNDITLWTGDARTMGAYQPFGDVLIELAGQDDFTAYQRELSLVDGEQHVRYAAHGVQFQREAFASHPAQVIVLRFSASKPGQYTGRVLLSDMHGAAIQVLREGIEAVGALPNGMQYASRLQVLHEGGSVSVDGNAIRFARCNSLTLILGAGTNYVADASRKFLDEASPTTRVRSQVEAAAKRPFKTLRTEHQRDYRALFSRMALDLGVSPPERRALPTDERIRAYTKDGQDPELEALYFQFGRYLLIASSRNSLPANLQGLWNMSPTPPWNSDYHSNINVQMNYWPAEVANLSELHRPFLDFVRSQLPLYRQVVADRAALAASNPSALPPEIVPWGEHFVPPQETFLDKDGKPIRGWTLRTETNPFGAMGYLWNKTGNAWYARHFWEHYAFTQDRKFLREQAWPLLKEVCAFWQDHLKTNAEGKLVAPNGWSPEHGPVEDGVSYDQEILWDLFDNTAQAAAAMGEDAQPYLALRDRLALPGIGSWGQLLEWMSERKDDLVLDTPGDTHRHVSHLFGLFPGHLISQVRTPAMAEAARKTLQGRGDAGTGWSMAWKAAYWARLGDGDHALKMLRGLLATPGARAAQQSGTGSEANNAGGTYPNMFDAHPPFQIDGNFGATAAMAEMLLQSQDGEIVLLPALPAEWANGSVRGLRARGGLEIDMRWARGRLLEARVHRIAGSGTVRLRHGAQQEAMDLDIKIGETRTLRFKND